MTIKYCPGREILLANTLFICPARSSHGIKLDMQMDYIAFNKAWILICLTGAQFKPLDLDLPLMYQSYLQQNPALS